jgi:hypothetical protein
MKRILPAVVCTIMIAGVCLEQSALATVALRTTLITTQQGGGCVIKLKEAGIQFLVPPGWEVEMDKGGLVTFSKSEGDSFIVATISALPPESSRLTPEAQFKLASERTFSSAKKDYQEFKLGAAEKLTQNRMPLTIQTYSGNRQGVDMSGSFALLQADQPVLIFTQVSTNVSATFVGEFSKVMNSVKKIE